MSDVCEGVRIVRPECPGGFCEINKEDLTEDMEIYGEVKGEPKRGRSKKE